MVNLRQKLLIGLLVNVGVVAVAGGILLVAGVADPLRGNIMMPIIITLIIGLFIWVPLVIGSGASSWLRSEPGGSGTPALVYRVSMPGAKWAARHYLRNPKMARILIDRDALRVTWGDGSVNVLAWDEPPTLLSRRVRAPYRGVESVVINAGSSSIQYVPYEHGRLLSADAYLAYFKAIEESTDR